MKKIFFLVAKIWKGNLSILNLSVLESEYGFYKV
jgi:hypothetical protein